MWNDYDENLSDNPFLSEIITNHNDIIKKASEESWIICVPCIDCLRQLDTDSSGPTVMMEITIDTILDHILVRANATNNNYQHYYNTLSKKPVRINNKHIYYVNNSSINSSCSIRILFEETYYYYNNNNNNRPFKYIVWCVDQVLFNYYYHHRGATINYSLVDLQTQQDCNDFLCNDTRDLIQKHCANFLSKNNLFEKNNEYSLQCLKELIGNLYSQCLQIVIKNCNSSFSGEEEIVKNERFFDQLKLAVETLMQSCLKHKLIRAINRLTSEGDAHFNKIVRNSHDDFTLNDLMLQQNYCIDTIITNAKCELIKLNKYVTILDKINCLKTTFSLLNQQSNVKIIITSDDILQIFVYLIIKLNNINNWIGNLIYLTEFNFSSLNNFDQNNYLMTTLEAAIEFIKSNQFMDIQKKHKTSSSYLSHNLIFKTLLDGDLITLKKSLDLSINNKNNKTGDKLILCHPLCSCDKCEEIQQQNNNNRLNINKTTNDKGQTLLIVASIAGRREIIEYLLINNLSDVNCRDYFGRTAMHYACAKGYQDIVLMLLNAKADTNISDNDGNVCLHLAANNGHDNCIQALVYASLTTLNVNCRNTQGDTPLHLAVKWNYIDLVRILLDNQAGVDIYNGRNQLAMDLTTNDLMLQLLQQYTNNNKTTITNKVNNIVNNNNIDDNIIINNNSCCKREHGIKPKNMKQLKKIEILLKAIENNDVPLTYYHLGVTYPSISIDTKNESKCHPLCDCTNCTKSPPLNWLSDYEIISMPPNTTTDNKDTLHVNTCNLNGFTALHYAAQYGRNEILRFLLDSQAMINVQTYNTWHTPLHLACINQRVECIRELVKCGDCEIDCCDHKGNTALYYACMKNDTRIVELLLSNGADCNVRNLKGHTILREVQDRRLYRVWKLLKDHSLPVATTSTIDNDDPASSSSSKDNLLF